MHSGSREDKLEYCGRMWRIGDKWEFQEDGTGIAVSVSMDNAADFGRRVYYLRRDEKWRREICLRQRPT